MSSETWLHLLDEPLPVESIGTCANYQNCKSPGNAVLGNNYCQRCWDLGIPNRHYKEEAEDE